MLSLTAEYALRAVSCLAGCVGQRMSADKIAEQTLIPRRYLTRVLQELTEHDIVSSRSGPGGGYELIAPPARVTIFDVIDAVTPIQRITHCPLGIESDGTLCPLHAAIDNAYATIEKAFAGVTIQQLTGSKGARRLLCKR